MIVRTAKNKRAKRINHNEDFIGGQNKKLPVLLDK